jgi:hypothetical protein
MASTTKNEQESAWLISGTRLGGSMFVSNKKFYEVSFIDKENHWVTATDADCKSETAGIQHIKWYQIPYNTPIQLRIVQSGNVISTNYLHATEVLIASAKTKG